LVKIIDDAFGIETALMTEIHAVTADQSVLDHAHRDLRRARASGQNIIPTTSSALVRLKESCQKWKIELMVIRFVCQPLMSLQLI
jgi:glyceraldehyde-3-phosphate dehydrogenase/erythrose-4-phosphate dehydrogenase